MPRQFHFSHMFVWNIFETCSRSEYSFSAKRMLERVRPFFPCTRPSTTTHENTKGISKSIKSKKDRGLEMQLPKEKEQTPFVHQDMFGVDWCGIRKTRIIHLRIAIRVCIPPFGGPRSCLYSLPPPPEFNYKVDPLISLS